MEGDLSAPQQRALAAFSEQYSTAEVYFSYQLIHDAITKPFRDAPPRVVFNAARFLLMRLIAMPTPPAGLSLSSIVFVLAQEAEAAEAWKLARFAYLKLQSLKVRLHEPPGCHC